MGFSETLSVPNSLYFLFRLLSNKASSANHTNNNINIKMSRQGVGGLVI